MNKNSTHRNHLKILHNVGDIMYNKTRIKGCGPKSGLATGSWK